MTPQPPALPVRRYLVHERDLGRHHALVVEEASVAAAAVAFAEDLSGATGAEVRLIVRDLADGCEHCFCIDLETGEAGDCA